MTKEEILAMEAGEGLNTFVAKDVMGLEVSYLGTRYPFVMVKPGVWSPPACYSTEISAAWQVVEGMEELGFYFKLDSWGVEFYASGADVGKNIVRFDALVSKLVSEAICKAALLVKLERG